MKRLIKSNNPIFDNKPIYRGNFEKYILPVIKNMIDLYEDGTTKVVTIQSGNGGGKSTLGFFISKLLKKLGYNSRTISIDDFIYPYKKLKEISEKYKNNPFYQVRGLPGTHDVVELNDTLEKIKNRESVEIPVFDKSAKNGKGDRTGHRRIASDLDYLFFDGWCNGIPNTTKEELVEISSRKGVDIRKIDPELKYSGDVIEETKKYQKLWDYSARHIKIEPQNIQLHKKWRYNQEVNDNGGKLSREETDKFVEPYLPFIALFYEKVKADDTLILNDKQEFIKHI